MIFGQHKLLKLAELCRVGARAARAIGDARKDDKTQIYEQAAEAEKIARRLEEIVDKAARTGVVN